MISYCYNTGNISVSYAAYSISDCYVGGICGGESSGTISNCYNSGNISATYSNYSSNDYSYVGGICGGEFGGTISNCYSTGTSVSFSGSAYVGGIYGHSANGVIQACAVFSDKIEGDLSYTIGHGGNKANNIAVIPTAFSGNRDARNILFDVAQEQSTYEDIKWDFNLVWVMVPGYVYPQLQGLPAAGSGPDNVPIGIIASDPSKSYVQVVDAYSISDVDSLPDTAVTIGKYTASTDKRGLASFDWVSLDQSAPLNVTKNGYLTYVWPYTGGYGADFRIVTLKPDRGIPDIVWTRLTKPDEQNGKSVDVSILSANIKGSQEVFNIEISAYYSKGGLVKCELMQGDKLIKTLTTHKDGIFTFSGLSGEQDGFVSGGDIYAQITANDGTVSEIIRLNIFIIPEYLLDDNFSVDFDTGPEFIIGNDMRADLPFIKGWDFKIDLNKIKADVAFDDEKVMISIGVQIFSEDLAENPELQKKKNREGFDNFKDEIMDALTGRSAWDKRLKDSMRPQNTFNNVEFKVYVVGYLEGNWWGDDQYLTGALMVQFEIEATKECYVWFIVVGVDLKTSVEIKLDGITYNLNERRFEDSSLGLDITLVLPSIEIRAGLGVPYIANAGGYGKGEVKYEQHLTIPAYGKLSYSYSYGLYYKVLFFSSHIKLGGDSDVPIKEWGTTSRVASVALMQYLQSDVDNFELSSRVHSSPWYGGIPHQVVLQENVYVETAPLIAEIAGKRVMVFLIDDPARGDMDRTKLVYSIYDKTSDTWSTPLPVMVDNNGMADFFPSLHSDGDNLYVVWHKSKNTFEELATLNPFTAIDAMFAASELAVAKFDVTTDTFMDVTYLTDNDFMDTAPSIAVNGDEVFVAWLSNTEKDYLGTSENNLNNIMYSTLQNGVWSEPTCLVSGMGPVIQLKAGYLNDKPCVAYITDTDHDFTTLDDRNLLLTYLSGNTVVLTDDVFVSNPDFTRINGVDAISWYSDGNIFYMSNDGRCGSLFDAPATGLMDVYKIINDGGSKTVVVYAAKDLDGVNYVYGHMYDVVSGRWSPRFKVAEIGEEWFARYIDGLIDGDDIYLAFTNTKMKFTETSLIEESNLCVLKIEPRADIKLDAVYYNNAEVRQGKSLPISLLVENTGNLAVSGIDVKANGEVIDRITIKGGLLPGETIWLETVMLNIPQDMPANTEFVISVEPRLLTDANFADNVKTIVLGFADVALELETYRIGDTVKAVANVVNVGDYGVTNVVLSACLGDSSDVLFEIDYGNLVAGQKKFTVIDIDPRDYDLGEEGFGLLRFVVGCDQEEVSKSNNADFIVLRTYASPPTVFTQIEPAPFYTVAFDSDGGGEVNSQRVREGSKALLPADPVKVGYTFVGWYLGESVFDFGAVIMGDVTLVAKWDAIPVVLKEITIDTLPTKMVYIHDEILDLTGLVVRAIYSDGSKVDVTGLVSVNPAQKTVLGDVGTRIITITYVDGAIIKNAIFTVRVDPKQRYNVNYSVDGVVIDVSVKPVGDAVIVLSDVPEERVGYVFAGWLYNGVVYRGGDTFVMPAVDVVLVAQWSPIVYYPALPKNYIYKTEIISGN